MLSLSSLSALGGSIIPPLSTKKPRTRVLCVSLASAGLVAATGNDRVESASGEAHAAGSRDALPRAPWEPQHASVRYVCGRSGPAREDKKLREERPEDAHARTSRGEAGSAPVGRIARHSSRSTLHFVPPQRVCNAPPCMRNVFLLRARPSRALPRAPLFPPVYVAPPLDCPVARPCLRAGWPWRDSTTGPPLRKGRGTRRRADGGFSFPYLLRAPMPCPLGQG